jgi:hypothetical protein
MGTTYHTNNEMPQKACETYSLSEEAIDEILRQEVLENRRIQQISTLRKMTHANLYARR